MFSVYILYSLKDRGIYIGKTNNLKRRLSEHSLGRVPSTKSRCPFRLIKTYKYITEKKALKMEKELKKGFRREQVKDLLKSLE